jgi:hypothetical protein
VDIDVTDATKLFLEVDPTEDGAANDHALWIEPRLIFRDGSERKLTGLQWTRADALWDQVSTDKAPGGGPMSHAGKPIEFGISTNGASRVEYALPAGAVRFTAAVALDDAAARARNGGTVRFLVFAVRPEDEYAAATLPVPVPLNEVGLEGEVRVRDLWTHEDVGKVKGTFAPEVPFHGAGLYRLSPQ